MGNFWKPIQFDYEVWESDFSKFVTEHYGIPYRHQQWMMDGQNTTTSFDVVYDDDITNPVWVELAEKELAGWKQAWEDAGRPPAKDVTIGEDRDGWKNRLDFIRDHGVSPEVIMWDLHRQGIVPVGRYLMTTWW